MRWYLLAAVCAIVGIGSFKISKLSTKTVIQLTGSELDEKIQQDLDAMKK